MRTIYAGSYVNGLDAKHRLSVPAPIRDVIETRSSTRALVLAPAEHRPCLQGYDVRYLESVQTSIDRRFDNDWSAARGDAARALFGMAETLKIDDNGRIIMTPILRELGEISASDDALFVGAGEYFELWNPEQFLAQEGLDPRHARMVKALLAQRRSA